MSMRMLAALVLVAACHREQPPVEPTHSAAPPSSPVVQPTMAAPPSSPAPNPAPIEPVPKETTIVAGEEPLSWAVKLTEARKHLPPPVLYDQGELFYNLDAIPDVKVKYVVVKKKPSEWSFSLELAKKVDPLLFGAHLICESGPIGHYKIDEGPLAGAIMLSGVNEGLRIPGVEPERTPFYQISSLAYTKANWPGSRNNCDGKPLW